MDSKSYFVRSFSRNNSHLVVRQRNRESTLLDCRRTFERIAEMTHLLTRKMTAFCD